MYRCTQTIQVVKTNTPLDYRCLWGDRSYYTLLAYPAYVLPEMHSPQDKDKLTAQPLGSIG